MSKSPRHILYIINPVSGSGRKTVLRKLIEERTTAQKIPFLIFPSVASGDYSFLKPVIKREKITDVIIAGGDGTINKVTGSLRSEKINFGIIPCGSGNGLALTADISTQVPKAIDTVFSGEAKLIDGFFVNDDFACMLCGLGFDAKIAHEFAKQPTRGFRKYAALVGKNFFSAKTYHFNVEAEGVNFSTDAYFISIANSNQFGNNFKIAPKASLNDGLLDIVIVKKTIKPVLLFTVMKQILRGKPKKLQESLKLPIIYFQTKELQIKNNEAPLHIDGDPAEMTEKIKIKIVPDSFRLIQP